MDHPLMGRASALGRSATFSPSRTGACDRPAPWLGQHTGQHTGQALREELGVSEAGLRETTERGTVYDKHPEAAQ